MFLSDGIVCKRLPQEISQIISGPDTPEIRKKVTEDTLLLVIDFRLIFLLAKCKNHHFVFFTTDWDSVHVDNIDCGSNK
jgi:hypothetical protein